MIRAHDVQLTAAAHIIVYDGRIHDGAHYRDCNLQRQENAMLANYKHNTSSDIFNNNGTQK